MRGVDRKNLSSKLSDGAYWMLRNLDFSKKRGGFTNRPGSKPRNASSLGAFPVRGGIRWYKGAQGTTPELIVGHDTSLYTISAAGVATAIGTGFTSDKEWFFQAYNPGLGSTKYVFAVNGTDAPRRWDGTTMRTMGFPAPVGNASAAANGGGSLTGNYVYVVTFIYDSNEAHESSAAATATITGLSNQGVTLSSIPVGGGSSGVTGRKIYRTKGNGSGHKFLTYIQDNVTTSINDIAADTDLSVVQAPFDNGVPPSDLKFIFIRKDRAYGIRTSFPNLLYMSAVTSTERSAAGGSSVHGAGVEIWPSTHYIAIGDDGAPLVSLDWHRDRLVIFQRSRIFTMGGLVPTDMRVEDSGEPVGCVAPRSVKNMGPRKGIFFLGANEGVPTVYRFNGVSVEPISEPIDDLMESNCVGLGSGASVLPCAGRDGGHYFLGYATNKGGTRYETAEFDTSLKRWQFHDNWEPACFIEQDGSEDRGELLYGHARAGWVVELGADRSGDFDADLTTEAKAVTMKLTTGWMAGSSPNAVTQLSYVDFTGEAQADAEIDISRSFNFDDSQAASTSQDGVADGDGAALTMTAKAGNAWHKRVDCGLSDRAIPEQGWTVQVDAEVTVTPSSAADPYKEATIHNVTVYSVEAPPVSHEQEYEETLEESE